MTIAATTPDRNAPCHCGSARKYKYCHYEADQLRRRSEAAAGGGVEAIDLLPSRAARRLSREHKAPRVRAGEENATTELVAWLSTFEFERIHLVRTSDTSKANFDTMRVMSLGDRTNPNVTWAFELGMDIVMPWGRQLREELGVFVVQRRHVPGGSGTALVRFLIPSPDGKDLFAFVLNSAATANVPSPDGRPENARNAFTELLCFLLLTQKPRELRTPLLTRLIRDVRWAGQVGDALRRTRTRLVVNNTEQQLAKKDDEFIFTVLSGIAAKDRRDINERLGGIESGFRNDGLWYGAERMLPFTWRFASEYRTNPLTGETERYVPDKHRLECTQGGKEVLRLLVDACLKEDSQLHTVGVELGRAGVLARDPAHFHRPVTLDQLANPANGARTLLQIEWINAWRHGTYEVVTLIKEDAEETLPPGATITEGADGRLYLECQAKMPAPVGGWGITEEEWDKVIARWLADSPMAAARRTHTGELRPFASVVQYDDTGSQRQWRLATFQSGLSYEVISRPLATAYDGDGNHVGWKHTRLHQTIHATLDAKLLHQKFADALEAALDRLEHKAASAVSRRPGDDEGIDPEALASLERQINQGKKVVGLKNATLEANSDPDLTDLLTEERNKSQADLEKLQKRLTRLTEAPPPQHGAASGKLETLDLEVLVVGLRRNAPRMDPLFNRLLSVLLRDTVRLAPLHRNTAWTLSGRFHLTLDDGRPVTVDFTTEPIPAIVDRNPRATSEHTVASASSERMSTTTLAELYFLDGYSLPAIARIRGLKDTTGSTMSDPYKALSEWLGKLGVPVHLRSAVLDIPFLDTRAAAYRALTAKPANDDEKFLHSLLTSGETKGNGLYAHVDQQTARAAFDLLRQAASNGIIGLPAQHMADRLGMPYSAVLAFTNTVGHKRKRGPAAHRPKLFRKDFGPLTSLPPDQRLIYLLDCERCRNEGRVGYLLPALLLDVPDGVLCETCGRQPISSGRVYPEQYRRRLISGSWRKLIATEHGEVWAGTRLLHGEAADGIAPIAE